MEKELLQLYETVKEAADATAAGGGDELKSAEDRCIEGLQRLKDFPVTSELLVSTQVGKRLRQLTKHPQNKIQSMASEVLGVWKQIVIQETDRKRKNGFTESEGSVKVESPSLSSGHQAKKFQRVDSIKAENVKKNVDARTDSYDSKKSQTGSSVKIEKVSATASLKVERFENSSTSSNSFKAVKSESSTAESVVKTGGKNTTTVVESRLSEEKRSSNLKKPGPDSSGVPKLTSIPQTKDKVRDKFREILAEALCKVSSEVDDEIKGLVSACDPNRVAVMIESSLFQKWGGSNGLNKAKYRSVMFNIKDPKNPDFRRRVLLGEYPPESIVDLPPEEMASDERKKQNNQIKEKALFDCERGIQAKASTDQFRCGRCGKKETTYYQLQTRSADEPMTTFVTCVNCNNHWKFC